MNEHLKLKNRLKEYRQKQGYTQTQLAERVGSSKNTISSIETGQFCPTAYLAALLCLALDCRFEDLFYFDCNGGADPVSPPESKGDTLCS